LLIGAIPGALPPLGGWVAATGNVGTEGMLLFAILFFWQLPHFLSLSWMYKTDYTRGGYKMLAVRDENGKRVAWQSLIYTVLLVLSAAGLFAVGTVGLLYAVGSVVLGGILVITCRKFLAEASHTAARQVLLMSYVYLMGIVILMLVDKT
jgi:protoheme IX farnesyltransferase